MAKVKVRIKAGSKGRRLGDVAAEYHAKKGDKGKELYRPKAKFTVHINDGRK